MTGHSDETRSEDEIRADLALCRSQPLHRVVGGVYRGAVATADALVCLLDDVPALLADLAAARAEVARLREAIEAVQDPALLAPVAVLRHGINCTMRQAIYDGARCNCDLNGQIQQAIRRNLAAAALSGSQEDERRLPGDC